MFEKWICFCQACFDLCLKSEFCYFVSLPKNDGKLEEVWSGMDPNANVRFRGVCEWICDSQWITLESILFPWREKFNPGVYIFPIFFCSIFFVPNAFVFSDICLQLNFITIFYDFSPNYTLKFDELAQYCFLEKLHFELTFTARLVRLCV